MITEIQCPECGEHYDFMPVFHEIDIIIECPECGLDGIVTIEWNLEKE